MIKHGNIYILFARCLWSSVCTVFEAHLVKHREKAEKKGKYLILMQPAMM